MEELTALINRSIDRLYFVSEEGISELNIFDIENPENFIAFSPEFLFCYFVIRVSIITNGLEIEEVMRYLIKYRNSEIGDHICNSAMNREQEIIYNKIKSAVSAALSNDEAKTYSNSRLLKIKDYTYIPSSISAFNVKIVVVNKSAMFEELKRYLY